MLDHIIFTTVYAIPNLAYVNQIPGFGPQTYKCNRIMEIKLQMQKKAYNDKVNLFKVIMNMK